MARRGLATDPIRNFKFQVTINMHSTVGRLASIGKLGFQTVSGMQFNNNIISYREGGDNTTPRKMPGTTDFGDVSFQHGVGAIPEIGGAAYTGQELYDWHRLIFSVVAGGGLNPGGVDFRAEVAIDLLAHPITNGASYAGMPRGTGTWPIKARYVLTNAWPSAISWGDFDASANSIAIETLTLTHEGIICIYQVPGSNAYVSNTDGLSPKGPIYYQPSSGTSAPSIATLLANGTIPP